MPECTHPLKVGTCSLDWPSRGEITFRDYQMRYRNNTPLVLNGLNLNIQSRQTVGTVGRAGSGEDKLWLCFFQVVFFAFPLGMLVKSHQRVMCMRGGLGFFSLTSLYCKLGFQVGWMCGVRSKHTSVFELIKWESFWWDEAQRMSHVLIAPAGMDRLTVLG